MGWILLGAVGGVLLIIGGFLWISRAQSIWQPVIIIFAALTGFVAGLELIGWLLNAIGRLFTTSGDILISLPTSWGLGLWLMVVLVGSFLLAIFARTDLIILRNATLASLAGILIRGIAEVVLWSLAVTGGKPL